MALVFHKTDYSVDGVTYRATYQGDLQQEFWKQLKAANVTRSARAKALLDLAVTTNEVLNVIGDLEGAEGQGGAGYAAFGKDPHLTHVMIWNPDTPLPFDAGGKWAEIVGWVDGVKKGTGEHKYSGGTAVLMPTYITILHELGHFEQCMTRRAWYLAQTALQRNAADAKEKTSCTSDIEADNLTRNEQPICEQLGLPKRQTYFDNKNHKLLTQNFKKFVP